MAAVTRNEALDLLSQITARATAGCLLGLATEMLDEVKDDELNYRLVNLMSHNEKAAEEAKSRILEVLSE